MRQETGGGNLIPGGSHRTVADGDHVADQEAINLCIVQHVAVHRVANENGAAGYDGVDGALDGNHNRRKRSRVQRKLVSASKLTVGK